MTESPAPRKRYNKIHIEISNVCNLQCSFCPEVKRQKGFMCVEDFEKIVAEVAPLAEQVCLHLMGEPLLHPQLERLVAICAEAGLPIFLVSNAVLLREKSMQLLLHPIFRQVNFSLHSWRDNFGDKDPRVYLDRIFQFTERAFQERPDLYINYRLWNLEEPRGMGEENRSMLERIAERFDLVLDSEVDVRQCKSLRLKQRLYLHFDTEFTWPSMELPKHGERGRCYGLSSHLGILVDGTVVPCCLDKEGVIKLGQITEQPLRDIVQGSRAQAMIKGFKEGRLVEELCQRCLYIERFKV